MNYASYKMMSDAIGSYGEGVRRRREADQTRQDNALRQELERDMHRWKKDEHGLRMQKIRDEMADAGEVRADRALQREIEPIRMEGQRYDDERAIVEDRMTQALQRRASLEKQIEQERDRRAKLAKVANDMRAGPTAKITRKAGDVTAAYEVPVSDVERALGGASAYQSPYSADVIDLDRQIAENEAEIAGGDNRTGFMGVGTSRRGVIDKAKQQRLQFKAMELRDMLERGIISQEEADRRAAVLMGR